MECCDFSPWHPFEISISKLFLQLIIAAPSNYEQENWKTCKIARSGFQKDSVVGMISFRSTGERQEFSPTEICFQIAKTVQALSFLVYIFGTIDSLLLALLSSQLPHGALCINVCCFRNPSFKVLAGLCPVNLACWQIFLCYE